jgi:tRNA-specific 2-thiouridylase
MKKIIVGMSGGVDSSVTALLLQQQGFQVEGLFMQNWQQDDEHCPMTQDLADAETVAAQLNIPLHVVSFANEYWDKVFQYFLDEYAAGRTPNPDILCNQEIKFKAFLDYALQTLQADCIATGHYAQIQQRDGKYYLCKGVDNNKDQSYFLYRLNQYQLARACFPLGSKQKNSVRSMAEQAHLVTSSKKDSTGICFIGERKFKQFLSEYVLAKPGNIETAEGEVIGRHDGLMYYTMGQRQGLGIGGRKHASEAPWYVVDKDLPRNVLIVGQGQTHPLLYKQQLCFTQAHWITDSEPALPYDCHAKIRYRQADQACQITHKENGRYYVTFTHPQRAVTPGQSIVIYAGECCLGGGIII